jgi:hypothetical protein
MVMNAPSGNSFDPRATELGTAPNAGSHAFVPDTIAATLIGSTPATLRRWRYEGRGPRYTKIGSTVRYKVADLESFVAARVVETSDTGPKPRS